MVCGSDACVCRPGLVRWDTLMWYGCLYASVDVDAGLVYETLLIASNGEEMFREKMKF